MFGEQLTDSRGRPICRECLGEMLRDDESGEDVCVSCGAVSSAPPSVLQLPASRVAMERALGSFSSPLLRTDLEIPTVVGTRDIDARGRPLSNNYDLRQLRKLSERVSWDSKRRRQAKVSTEIRRTTEALGLGTVVMERAYDIYTKCFNPKAARATSVSAAAAAAVCVACLELEIPRPPDDTVALKLNVDPRRLRHHYKILAKSSDSHNIPDPATYVSAIATRASLAGLTERKALDIIARTRGSENLIGKRPVSIAAAALYLASLETADQTTQMRLAFAARVSPITVRKISGEIAKTLAIKLPQG
jgi:transcription initiation factor TFIIB